MIADWLIGLAPSDPRTHYFAATVFERSFDADELGRSVREYELATSLSPHSYGMWLSLGRARGLLGDTEGSLKAFRRALDLAPNYALVQWIYGNALLRSGQADEGFALIARAAASDTRYAGPAISTGLQMFEGNPEGVRRMMGNTASVNAGLAKALMKLGRFDESFESWQRLEKENDPDLKPLGESLLTELVEQKKFRLAAKIQADISQGERPEVSKVVNGGFEEEVKLGSSAVFNWRISEGTHPQVGLSDVNKRSGRFSLLLAFNSIEASGLRSIDQTIAVEPSAEYEFEVFYRSELRSDAILKWEVIDASNMRKIAESEPLIDSAEWKPLRIRFGTPTNSDGIQIRLVRQGCSGLACPMNGRVFFDDISLRGL